MGKPAANGGWRCTIPAPPQVKERPRLGRRRRVYTPEKTLDAEALIRAHWDGPFYEGPVKVRCEYHADKTVVTVTPCTRKSKLRGDVDNYVKTTLDGLSAPKNTVRGAFRNDRQVTELVAVKR